MTDKVRPATDEQIAEYRKLASLEMKRVLARLDEAERRIRWKDSLLRRTAEIVGEFWAAVWDGHYGNGLSADRCRALDERLRYVGLVPSRSDAFDDADPPDDWTGEE